MNGAINRLTRDSLHLTYNPKLQAAGLFEVETEETMGYRKMLLDQCGNLISCLILVLSHALIDDFKGLFSSFDT